MSPSPPSACGKVIETEYFFLREIRTKRTTDAARVSRLRVLVRCAVFSFPKSKLKKISPNNFSVFVPSNLVSHTTCLRQRLFKTESRRFSSPVSGRHTLRLSYVLYISVICARCLRQCRSQAARWCAAALNRRLACVRGSL